MPINRRPVTRPTSMAGRVPVTTASELGRMIPSEIIPAPEQGKSNDRTQVFTYFTKPGETRVLYNADQNWVKVTLTLETAGPVAVGMSQTITPVLSGKGQLLPTLQARSFTIARGNRLFIAATAVNRVSVIIEPFPWLEQLLGGVMRGFTFLLGGRK